MAIYTGVADANGDFNIPFSANYTGGQKVTVTAKKDAATKTIEIFAPSGVTGGGAIQFSGSLNDFPLNIGNVALTEISGKIKSRAFQSSASGNAIGLNATGLAINAEVTEIESWAFSGWMKATSLILPQTILKLGQYAFDQFGGAGLGVSEFIMPNSINQIDQYTFRYFNCTYFKLSESITLIPVSAFDYANIKNFDFSNVQTISANAFSNAGLLNINLPNTVSTIGNSAFANNTKALSIKTGDTVSAISDYAFYSAAACKDLEIGSSVTSCGAQSFALFTSCDQITCKAVSPPTIQANTFASLKSTCIIKVPAASVAAYQAAPNWSAFAARIQAI